MTHIYYNGTLTLHCSCSKMQLEEELQWYRDFIKKNNPKGLMLGGIHGNMYRCMRKLGYFPNHGK